MFSGKTEIPVLILHLVVFNDACYYLSMKLLKKHGLLLLILVIFTGGLYAQTGFPAGDFWSLDAGFGMGGMMVDGTAFQLFIDPKLWLTPPLMIGVKTGISYSTEHDHIFTLEGQAYLRWNFLSLGSNPERLTSIFIQGGLGLLASYRGSQGSTNPFDDVTRTRGSVLADAAAGVTIPLTPRWHIEPLVRGGYPHMWGVSLTAGYKFPMRHRTKYEEFTGTEYVEIIRTIPAAEIVRNVLISEVEYILFGADTGIYNAVIDRDAQQLNELVLNEIAHILHDNPNCVVRIEGHANPITASPAETEVLMTLSAARANAVAEQLKARGVNEEQIITIALGGTRNATSDWDARNRNRRVELIIVQVDAD